MNPQRHYVVQDYMQKQVATINKTAVLREAVEHMVHTKTNGLVVVDDAKKVVGMVSTKDIIAFIVPDYLEEDKHLASFEAEKIFAERVKQFASEPVEKFMTSEVHTVQMSHPLMEAAALMAEFKIRQLPVVDEKGTLLGYITRTNIKHAIADILEIPWVIEA